MTDLLIETGRTLIETVLPALATVIGGYLVLVLRRKAQTLGVDLTAAQEARLRALAAEAVHAVEEQAHRRATDGRPMSGLDKRAEALARLPVATADPVRLATALDAAVQGLRR